MIVRGLAQAQLTAIAHGLSLELSNLRPVGRTDGHAWAFHLVPLSSRGKYARRAASGRRTKATCYHGFRDAITRFFDAGAFSVNTVGQRRLKSGYVEELRRITIHSVEEFTEMLPDFASRNVGSLYNPVTYAELCECEECDVCHQVFAPGDAARSGAPGHMQTVCGPCIGKRERDMHARADAYAAQQQGIDVCIECGQPTIPHGSRCIAHEQARQARADAYARQQQREYRGGCRISGCESECKEDSVYCGYHDFCERNPRVCQEPSCRVPMSADRTSCYCYAHNRRCDVYGCMNYAEAPRNHNEYLNGMYCEYHAVALGEYARRDREGICQVNGCSLPLADASMHCNTHTYDIGHTQCAHPRCERPVAGTKLFCFEHELRPCEWVECGSLSLTDEQYCAAHHYAAFRRQTAEV